MGVVVETDPSAETDSALDNQTLKNGTEEQGIKVHTLLTVHHS